MAHTDNALCIRYYGTVACLGGGRGIQAIAPLARDLKNAGNRLIVIYPDTAWEAWVILGGDVRWFGDNYEDPDGPIYCRPARLFDDKVIDALRARRLGHVESGWHKDDYHAHKHERDRMHAAAPEKWCGYSLTGDLYYIADEPAPTA
jgi:hypothetical protein